MKSCTKCKVEKTFTEFRKIAKGDKNGLNSWCKDCERARRRNHYQSNIEKYAAQSKAWWEANPDARRAHDLNRYALKKNAKGTITKEIVRKVLDTYGEKCLACGATDRIEIDHVVPLTKGGTNLFENLQPLCKGCNVRKGNRNSNDYRLKGEGRTTP